MRGDRKEIMARQDQKKNLVNSLWKMHEGVIDMDREKF